MTYRNYLRTIFVTGLALAPIWGSTSLQAATVNAVTTGAWTAPATWESGALPSDATNDDFVVAGGLTVSSPATTSSFTPDLDTLSVNATGTLAIPTTANNVTITIPSLTVDGGVVAQTANFNTTSSAGLTTILAGSLVVGNNGATIEVGGDNTGSNTVNRNRYLNISAAISGSGDIVRTGFGLGNAGAALQQTLILSGDNSGFTGNISSNHGFLFVNHANALGTSPGTISLSSGTGIIPPTELRLNSPSLAIANKTLNIDATNSQMVFRNSGTGDSSWGGPINITNTGVTPRDVLFIAGAGTLTIGGDVDASSYDGVLYFRGATVGVNEVTGQITKTTSRVVKWDPTTWTFSNVANDIATFVGSQGTSRLGAENGLGATGNGPNLLMGSTTGAGIVELNGFNQTISGLGLHTFNSPGNPTTDSSLNAASHTNTITNTSGTTSTLTIQASTDQSFPGAIAGNANLVVNMGSPTTKMTFEGEAASAVYGASAHTYTGTTSVAQGVLVIDGSHSGGGEYTIGVNGALAGSGAIGSIVNLSGSVSPGSSPGTLAVGGLNINDGSILNFELNAADTAIGGGVNDLIDVNGLLDVLGTDASTLTLNVLKIGGGNLDASGTWTLLTYDSLSADLSFDPSLIGITGIDPGYTASIGVTPGLGAGAVTLTLNIVPEPTAFVMSVVGVICVTLRRNRRR